MGFMPAYRGGGAPLFSLKEIVISPGNSERGLDPHQGAVLLHDGETGELRAIAQRLRRHRDPHRRGVRRRDAPARAPGSRVVAVLGAGVQGRSHVEAMRRVLGRPEIRLWSRTPAQAEALAEETQLARVGVVEEALAGADIVCTHHGGAGADLSSASGSHPERT